MGSIDRRSAVSLGLAATAALAAASTSTQAAQPMPVRRTDWGKGEATILGYKSVSMRDVIYQPGAKTSDRSKPNDMICHVPEGELLVRHSDGMKIIAKKGDVWTCRKGIDEDVQNVSSTLAIMRIIDLLAG
jgi:quercetin dioxygenase-like cupin family protein